jgi:hypothetical protein
LHVFYVTPWNFGKNTPSSLVAEYLESSESSVSSFARGYTMWKEAIPLYVVSPRAPVLKKDILLKEVHMCGYQNCLRWRHLQGENGGNSKLRQPVEQLIFVLGRKLQELAFLSGLDEQIFEETSPISWLEATPPDWYSPALWKDILQTFIKYSLLNWAFDAKISV